MKIKKNSHNQLSAKGLYKRYGKRWVVRDVDLNVNKGEIVGLLGPNGAGKTTTFYMITGMIKPTKGEIFLDENKITDRAMYQRSRSGIGYLSQVFHDHQKYLHPFLVRYFEFLHILQDYKCFQV